MRDDIVPKVGDAAILAREAKRLAENAVVAAATAGGRSDGGSVAIDARGDVAAQTTTLNHMQASVSRASVNAEEALRLAREMSSKIGSLEAGMSARVVMANEAGTARTKELNARVSALTKRVDLLSSEIAVARGSNTIHKGIQGEGIGLGLI